MYCKFFYKQSNIITPLFSAVAINLIIAGKFFGFIAYQKIIAVGHKQ